MPSGLIFHHVGLVISALFGLLSILFSWYLIWRHATHYLKPWEQKQYVPSSLNSKFQAAKNMCAASSESSSWSLSIPRSPSYPTSSTATLFTLKSSATATRLSRSPASSPCSVITLRQICTARKITSEVSHQEIGSCLSHGFNADGVGVGIMDHGGSQRAV